MKWLSAGWYQIQYLPKNIRPFYCKTSTWVDLRKICCFNFCESWFSIRSTWNEDSPPNLRMLNAQEFLLFVFRYYYLRSGSIRYRSLGVARTGKLKRWLFLFFFNVKSLNSERETWMRKHSWNICINFLFPTRKMGFSLQRYRAGTDVYV